MVDSPRVSYLTARPQLVRVGAALSAVVVSDMGAPQGTVPSPLLFTSDFESDSDDSAVVGLWSGEDAHSLVAQLHVFLSLFCTSNLLVFATGVVSVFPSCTFFMFHFCTCKLFFFFL